MSRQLCWARLSSRTKLRGSQTYVWRLMMCSPPTLCPLGKRFSSEASSVLLKRSALPGGLHQLRCELIRLNSLLEVVPPRVVKVLADENTFMVFTECTVEGAEATLAGVLMSPSSTDAQYFAGRVPDAVMEAWAKTEVSHPVVFAEMASLLIARLLWSGRLSPTSNLEDAVSPSLAWFARVPSKSNLADLHGGAF
eukprot:989844-Amphidinium_carterae.1